MKRIPCLLFLALAAVSCTEAESGNDAAEDGPVEQPDAVADPGMDPDAADPDADGGPDADVPDDGVTDEPLPEPEQLRPCENGSCWDTDAIPARCRETTVNEDFSSGRYNVHAYGSTLFGGSDTAVTLTRTGGAWQPAIIVAEGDLVIYDGAVGLVREGLSVTRETDGTSGDEARVLFTTDRDLHVTIHVTGWEVVESDFVDFLPTDATYRLLLENVCDLPPVECEVNGHTVDEPACGWLYYIALEVVPLLEGTRSERVDKAAVVGWWSLKEGVLFLDYALSYSNCGYTDGQRHIGPLEVCPSGLAWQVGLAAVQVPDHPFDDVVATALRLFPGMSVEEILEAAAVEAGLSSAEVAAVVASTDQSLRKSWLLRSSPVGFTHEEGLVTDQCIDRRLSWCFDDGWYPSNLFAPDYDSAMAAIEDVRAIIDALAP
jgi:hypothetical protein